MLSVLLVVLSTTFAAASGETVTDAPCAIDAAWLAALDHPARCHTVALGQAWERAASTGQTRCLSDALERRGIRSTAMNRPARPLLRGKSTGDTGGADTGSGTDTGTGPDTGTGEDTGTGDDTGAGEDTGTPVEKEILSTYNAPYSLDSENFVVFWGSEYDHFDSYSDVYSRMEDLLVAFEETYAHEVGVMGMNAISFMEGYKFNVYLGNTGDDLPSSSGAAGYFTGDSSGNPMIMIAEGTAASSTGYMKSVIAHEFFHALQWATGAYSYSGVAAWYWEATASWAAHQVYPGEGDYAVFLYAFAKYQFLPLNYFDYPDSGLTSELHQYGAFIFPQFISEIAADWEIVRDSWIATGVQDDPLSVVDTHLKKRGQNVIDEWARFIAYNANWDYEDGQTYQYYLEAYDWIGDGEEVQWGDYGDGQKTMIDPPGELPHGKGSNLFYLKYPNEGDVIIEFQGDEQGSDGSDVDWRLTLVLESANDLQYEAIPVEDNYAKYTLESGHGYDAIYLAIGSWSEDASTDETFSYQWRFGVGEPSDEDDTGDTGHEPEPGGCGCTALAPLSMGWMVPLLAFGWATRRQRPISRTTTPAPSSNV